MSAKCPDCDGPLWTAFTAFGLAVECRACVWHAVIPYRRGRAT